MELLCFCYYGNPNKEKSLLCDLESREEKVRCSLNVSCENIVVIVLST